MCADRKNSPINRRKLLQTLGTLGASMLVAGCANKMSTLTSASTSAGGTADDATGNSCVASADETNGPFPADGSNAAGDGSSAILDDVYPGSPILRANITSDTSDGTVVSGIPLNLALTLQNVNRSCEVLTGYFIYIWHCTPTGRYSAYSGGMNGGTHSRTETYLRGIQQTNAAGQVTFATVYPGWYNGRAVHIHAEIYKTLSATSPVKITQMAFPMSVNNTVQATSGYPGVAGMLSNSSDNVFSDGTSTEMLSVNGNA